MLILKLLIFAETMFQLAPIKTLVLLACAMLAESRSLVNPDAYFKDSLLRNEVSDTNSYFQFKAKLNNGKRNADNEKVVHNPAPNFVKDKRADIPNKINYVEEGNIQKPFDELKKEAHIPEPMSKLEREADIPEPVSKLEKEADIQEPES